jgi:glycosyltransferase involved in cell wall biosynthesis
VRICVVGKFPPIQGGVSMRTYWTAHGLAQRGHEVHVVTNAKEAEPPFRMLMRPADWARCGASYGKGSVAVHWTDPADWSQHHLPMASPFASKLAGMALGLHAKRPFDVIYSHYLEPYGVAAHVVAQSTRVPHVARMAGSDAGRLWHHRQLEPLYDEVLRAAAAVITGPVPGQRALARGIDPRRLAVSGGFSVPERLFKPTGPVLDIAALRAQARRDPALRHLAWGGFRRGRPYVGVYGKLGDRKGSFALLEAMHRLKRRGVEAGLVAVAHGEATLENRFRDRVRRLGLKDRVLQLPFIPHWRIPEFLRGCAAVCCLEQDFPIAFHDPIVAREVLLCAGCLIGSAEIVRKIPHYEQFPNGYGCVALEDVHDIGALSKALAAVITDPEPALDMRARGCAFVRVLQENMAFPETLERILVIAARRQPLPEQLQAVDLSRLPARRKPT